MSNLVYSIVPTDEIKLKYAQLPISSLKAEFICEMIAPLPMIPHVRAVFFDLANPQDVLTVLKDQVFGEYKQYLQSLPEDAFTEENAWLKDIRGVQLIECDLLTEKK